MLMHIHQFFFFFFSPYTCAFTQSQEEEEKEPKAGSVTQSVHLAKHRERAGHSISWTKSIVWSSLSFCSQSGR